MWFPPPVVDVFGAFSSITHEDRCAMWLVFPLYGTVGKFEEALPLMLVNCGLFEKLAYFG